MDISEIVFSPQVDVGKKVSFVEFAHENNIVDPNVRVLVPTDSNDDVDGSQHVSDGGSDFSYRDAEFSDVESGSTLGYYDYFSCYGNGEYTGHYYNGDGRHFSAIVVDPPAYAVSGTL